MAGYDIRDRAQECREHFELLLRIKEEIGVNGEAEGYGHDVSWIQDQLARFKMWAGNIGAFAEGHASLDYRLRDSDETKHFLLGFLGSLADFIRTGELCPSRDLKPCTAVACGLWRVSTCTEDGTAIESSRPLEVAERADSPLTANTLDDIASFGTSPSSAISSSFQGTETESLKDVLSEAATFETNIGRRKLQGIEKAIDRLYRLSLIIRQPSRESQNERARHLPLKDEEGNNIDASFASFAKKVIDHRFPQSPEYLRHKLAYGIVIRRKRFLYRQNHQRKLSGVTNLTVGSNKTHDDGHNTEKLESTVRNLSFSEPKIFDEAFPLRTPVKPEATPSKTSASAIPKEPLPLKNALEESQSNPSTVFSTLNAASQAVDIPPPPKPVCGSKEFECPYCCLVLPLKLTKAARWRRHIIEDLEPYTCVFGSCQEDVSLFSDRGTWIRHLQAHQAQWICSSRSHAAIYLDSEEEYRMHMITVHPGTFTDTQLPLLAKRNRRPAMRTFECCPLCLYVPKGDDLQVQPHSTEEGERLVSDWIMKHLAAHLEYLAVMALPWPNVNEDTSEDRSQTGRAQDTTVQSEEGSRKLSLSKSVLNFADLGAHAEAEDVLPTDYESTSSPDITYEIEWGFIERPPYFGHDRDEVLQPLLQRLFLGRSAPSAVFEPKLPAYLVPVYRDRKFYGRETTLNIMHQTLCASKSEEGKDNKPMTFPRCYAVYGPGGMGKTQMAAHFVAQHRDEFDAILWVHAEDKAKLLQDYKDIAIQLGLVSAGSRDAMDLEYTKDVLKRWLVNPRRTGRQHGGKRRELASWLLVFDGVEDGQVLNDFWPYNGPGSVLITSRNPNSWSTSLELRPFSIQEATDYLFYLTERETTQEEVSAATDIAKRLGGLPLALSQMGRIIMHRQCSFAAFLHSFKKNEGSQVFLDWRLPDPQRQSSNYEYNVASVWAFDRIPKGLPLISVLSMLDPDAIPESLFVAPVKTTDSNLTRLIKTDYYEARAELFSRSLITYNKQQQKLFVHRLVQDVARSRMRQSDTRSNFFVCVELINAAWPFQELTWRHGVARWGKCEALFPHIQRLKAVYPTLMPSPDSCEDYEFARLLIDSAWYEHERGKSLEAIVSNNMAQSICESLKLRLLERSDMAQDSSVTLDQLNYSLVEMAHNRGCIALEINEPTDALKYHTIFNDIMIKEKHKHHPDDMRLAISWNELGNAFMLNRDWKTGEECFKTSIAEMQKYGKFKPTTISLPLANLGLAYWLQGKHHLASETLLQGLRDREDEFGQNDRESFITGRFLHALGNVESSFDYHRRALMHYKSTLGNRHHRTADMFVKVAEHNILLNNPKMALALLDHSLEAFSVSHTYMPEKTRATWMRYKALKGLGRIKDAENELIACFQIYAKLRSLREDSSLAIKTAPEELKDADIDDLIVFWSK